MRKYRPTKHDLENVPWAPPRKDDIPRFVTELYYGRVTVSHHDREVVAEIGAVMRDYVKKLGFRTPPRIDTLWIHHKDGREFLDAVMDKATGEWRRPTGGSDRR